jgi:hypothetical protein
MRQCVICLSVQMSQFKVCDLKNHTAGQLFRATLRFYINSYENELSQLPVIIHKIALTKRNI